MNGQPQGAMTQLAVVYAADEAEEDRIGPVGGPVTSDGVIALRTAAMGVTAGGDAASLVVVSDNADGQAVVSDSDLLTQNRPMLYDASENNWDRQRSASAATQGATTSRTGIPVVVKGSEWSSTAEPGAGVLASVTRAAGGAGVRHVVTGFTFCLACDALPSAPIRCRIRDNATTLWVGCVSALANTSAVLQLDNLALPGTANTTITAEFDNAGPADSLQTVTMHGYDTA